MKVLFVCTANKVRSPMAAEIFLKLAGLDSAFAARSVGTMAQGMRRLTTRQLAWADAVAVMETRHLAEIRNLWPDQVGKVRVLEVPDDYDPGEPELRDLLTEKLKVLLAELQASQYRHRDEP